MRPDNLTLTALIALLGAGLAATGCGLQASDAAGGSDDGTGGDFGQNGGAGGAGPPGTGATGTVLGGTDAYAEDGLGPSGNFVDFANCEGAPLDGMMTLAPDDARATGSATYARAMLSALDAPFGLPPAPSSMHPHQMVNYYGLGEPLGDDGVLEAAPFIDDSGNLPSETDVMIQVAVSAPSDAARRAVHVAFVVDTSGSMTGAAMANQKAILTQAAAKLGQGEGTDVVSVVSWSGEAATLLAAKEVVPNDPALLDVIAGLESEGGSNLDTGLRAAFDLVTKSGPSLKRIVFVTDGAATAASAGEVLAQIRAARASTGLGFIGVGVGPAESYHATLLKEIVSQTDGTFAFVGSEQEAADVFGARFDGLMDSFGTDARLTLSYPGYLSDPTLPSPEEQPAEQPTLVRRDLPVGGTLVFRRRLVACNAEVFSASMTQADQVTAVVELTGRDNETITLTPAPILVHSIKAGESPRMRRARALIDYGLALGDPTVDRVTYAQAQLVGAGMPELGELVGRHPIFNPPGD